MSLARQLVARFGAAHAFEAARVLADQPPQETAAVLRELPADSAARVLAAMAPAPAAASLDLLGPDAGSTILARLAPGDLALLLRGLPPEQRGAWLARLPEPDRLRPLLEYPAGAAASLMDPQLLALPADLDLDEARRQVGRFASRAALELFVVDQERRLVGVVDLRQLLDAARRGPLAPLVMPVEPLAARTGPAAMAAHPGWRRFASLPVVDDGGRYLGAVRHDRLRSALEETPAARRSRGGLNAVVALGALYWIGLGGLLTGFAPSARRTRDVEAES